MLANVALAVAAFAIGVVLGGLGVRSAGLSSARWPVQVTVLCLVELVELVVLLVLTGVWLATGALRWVPLSTSPWSLRPWPWGSRVPRSGSSRCPA